MDADDIRLSVFLWGFAKDLFLAARHLYKRYQEEKLEKGKSKKHLLKRKKKKK